MVSRCIATIEEDGEVCSLAMMKDKKHFISATARAGVNVPHHCWKLKLWDVETRDCVRTFVNGHDDVRRIQVCALDDETFLCYLYAIDVVAVYSIHHNNHMKTIMVNTGRRYSFAPLDGDRFLSGQRSGEVKLWSIERGECQKTFGPVMDGPVQVFKVDDSRFLSADERYEVALLDVETGQLLKRIEVNCVFTTAVVDSKHFITFHSYSKRLNLWNTDTGECIRTATTSHFFGHVLPICGRGILFCKRYGSRMELWDCKIEKMQKGFVGHEGDVRSIDVVDDTMVITGSLDGAIQLWDVTRWPDLKTLICLRKLVVLGRAEDFRRSKRLRTGSSSELDSGEIPSLRALISETTDDIFRKVLSFLA